MGLNRGSVLLSNRFLVAYESVAVSEASPSVSPDSRFSPGQLPTDSRYICSLLRSFNKNSRNKNM
jgi:hypothetical protein